MNREIIFTADGSATVQLPGTDITYHSRHGALQESMHVFIHAGLQDYYTKYRPQQLRIFEMGFGTGLNTLLTYKECKEHNIPVEYETVELHPLSADETDRLNYEHMLPGYGDIWKRMHACDWNEPCAVSLGFLLTKHKTSLMEYDTLLPFDIIYYDAFAPSAQPELWTQDVFARLYAMAAANGTLVTYCSKSDVRRAMQATGWQVEKIPGPRGKREMLRAVKA